LKLKCFYSKVGGYAPEYVRLIKHFDKAEKIKRYCYLFIFNAYPVVPQE
jgi:hypothetical protein